jgi:membrane-associated phospholipid phosphatase
VTDRARTLAHPWVVVAVALVAGAAAWAVAVQEPVPSWELDLTERINGAPDALARALFPVMQAGTLGAPLVAAVGILVVRRDRLLALATVGAGLVAWFGAKGVKAVVERGRPLAYLPDIDVREGSGTGLGFVSGHSAVAMATALMVAAAVPHRWRWAVLAIPLLVGLARIVVGVHLPADVVGGWALGALVGVAALAVVDHLRPPAVDGTPT